VAAKPAPNSRGPLFLELTLPNERYATANNNTFKLINLNTVDFQRFIEI
jgi:hypothetical protein